MAISGLLGREGGGWFGTRIVLYGQDFVAKNPGWSPIRELAMTAGTYTQSVSAD